MLTESLTVYFTETHLAEIRTILKEMDKEYSPKIAMRTNSAESEKSTY
jgi:hypothetical protein